MWILWAPLASATTPPYVAQARERTDWDLVAQDAADWLSEYIQADTVNPPGNEMNGVVWMKRILDGEGFETTVVDHGDNRGSLIARLRGSGKAPPLCLLSHIDVVTSEPDLWEKPPLSGEQSDGFVWGRGALDMKGMGVAEMMAATLIARQGQKLDRDVVILAVADEELDGIGMQTLVNEHWTDIGCSHLINEGGMGLPDVLFEGQTIHAISTAEKGVLWVRLVAEGEPGHGSTVRDDEAPLKLLEAMELVEKRYKPKYTFDPAMREMFVRVGEHKGGMTGALLKTRFGQELFVKPKLKARGQTRAVLQNTVHLTGLGGAGGSTNVVPSESWASYDCRLLPGVEPRAFLAELEALTADLEGVHWEVVDEMPANRSSYEDPFFERIAHYAVEDDPEHSVAVPVLSPGFTDSIYARPKGVNAYGYVPFVAPEEEMAGFHGNNERISIENLKRATRVLYSLVLDFAGAGEVHPDVQAVRDELDAIPRAGGTAGLAGELEKRVAIDQRVRQAAFDGTWTSTDRAVAFTVDALNTARMKAVVQANGWPTINAIGKKGAHDAWLLVQHADQDPAFQRDVLARMEKLLDSGQVSKTDYAYLYDRVAVNAGEPQKYATQGQCTEVDGKPAWQPLDLVSPEGVERRRREMGMSPLAEYEAMFDCGGRRAEASAKYRAKEYGACAGLYAELARSSAGRVAMGDWYNAACCAALAGETDAAFEHLEAALAAGMPWTPHVETEDTDLATLRADARWAAVLERHQPKPEPEEPEPAPAPTPKAKPAPDTPPALDRPALMQLDED